MEGKLSIMMTSNGKIKCWDVPSILMEIPKAYTCQTCQIVLTARWDYGVIRTQLLHSDWERNNEPSIYRYNDTRAHQS